MMRDKDVENGDDVDDLSIAGEGLQVLALLSCPAALLVGLVPCIFHLLCLQIVPMITVQCNEGRTIIKCVPFVWYLLRGLSWPCFLDLDPFTDTLKAVGELEELCGVAVDLPHPPLLVAGQI